MAHIGRFFGAAVLGLSLLASLAIAEDRSRDKDDASRRQGRPSSTESRPPVARPAETSRPPSAPRVTTPAPAAPKSVTPSPAPKSVTPPPVTTPKPAFPRPDSVAPSSPRVVPVNPNPSPAPKIFRPTEQPRMTEPTRVTPTPGADGAGAAAAERIRRMGLGDLLQRGTGTNRVLPNPNPSTTPGLKPVAPLPPAVTPIKPAEVKPSTNALPPVISKPANPSTGSSTTGRPSISDLRDRIGGPTKVEKPGTVTPPMPKIDKPDAEIGKRIAPLEKVDTTKRVLPVEKVQPGDRMTLPEKVGPRPADKPSATGAATGIVPLKRDGSLHDQFGGPRGKPDLKDPTQKRFPDRLKDGQLAELAKGDAARQIKLDEQMKMLQKGDVARRMELHKHFDADKAAHLHPPGGRPGDLVAKDYPHLEHPYYGYHGAIHHGYTRGCFPCHYWGPGYYPSVVWYPVWSPWLGWCWNYQCGLYLDPRPYWCRPVVYMPCPRWNYYVAPVWTPLPTGSCGTWVDVHPSVVINDVDLQLLAVRFVDPGHPEEKLGPRYRVWLRNNSQQAVTTPFNVVALASADDQLAANLPQAGVRVTSIEAGETQSVDIRLPFEVGAMARDAAGQPAPFATLHVLVDANRELPESNRQNNGVKIARTEVFPVDPAAFEVRPTSAAAGSEVILAGEGFGPAPGRVLVNLGGRELDGEIVGWCDLGVRFNLPQVAIAAPTKAEVILVRGDSAAANPVAITMVPGAAKAGDVVPIPPAPRPAADDPFPPPKPENVPAGKPAAGEGAPLILAPQ